MTTASQKQIDYINSMIDSIEKAEAFAKMETQIAELRSSDDWQAETKIQMLEGQIMQWHAELNVIRLRRNPMTLPELKVKTSENIANLRQRVSAELSTIEASQIIDMLKNKRIV